MRLFELFMRRAGVQQAPVRSSSSFSRFTVVCSRHDMASVRKQICLDFEAAGLPVSTIQIDRAPDPDLAVACVTVSCAPESRADLMNSVRQVRNWPGVRQVQWGDRRPGALN